MRPLLDLLTLMCGIAGIAALPGAPTRTPGRLKAMCDTIVHRGPDDEGTGGSRRRRPGHAAPVDHRRRRRPAAAVQRGPQRCGSCSTARSTTSANCASELEAAGHRFSSGTDARGDRSPLGGVGAAISSTSLNGMFAIALHDERKRRASSSPATVSASSRCSTPSTDRHLVFGSEIKALLARGLVPRELDLDALGEFLAWEYVPGAATLLRGIRKLEPGAMPGARSRRRRRSRRERYWDLPPAGRRPVPTDAEPARSGTTRSTRRSAECVRRQLVSDVPLGAFLSGGVDSSLVVAGMGGGADLQHRLRRPDLQRAATGRKRVADHLGVSPPDRDPPPRRAWTCSSS